MTNLEQNNIDLIECDEATATKYLAIAEMEQMEEDDQMGDNEDAEAAALHQQISCTLQTAISTIIKIKACTIILSQ